MGSFLCCFFVHRCASTHTHCFPYSVQDGFGIGYIIRDNGVQYSISSKHRQTERYAHTLKQTLIDMGKLLKIDNAVKVACDVDDKPKLTPRDEEFCDAYGDSYGESTSFKLPNKPPERKPRPSLKPSPSQVRVSGEFSRVMRRQSSFSVAQLQKFGQKIEHVGSTDEG